MTGWMLPRVWQYWDHRVGAVGAHVTRLESYDEWPRERALEEISACVARHCAQLSDDDLTTAAYVLVEDLYKGVLKLLDWTPVIPAYLGASAGTFCRVLGERGYVLHYMIDNSYETDTVGMAGPLDAFKHWFGAAGLAYICPQFAAREAMRHDGHPDETFASLIPRYIQEGRMIAHAAVDKCKRARTHFVYLDTDATDESLAPIVTGEAIPGRILVTRWEAPLPGSRCRVTVTPRASSAIR